MPAVSNAEPEPFTRTYRLAMAVCRPLAWWGGIQVEGVEALPRGGPVLLASNHDSYFDPLLIGVAAARRRQIRALAKAALWDVRGLGPILDGMGQVPIERATGDAGALASAIDALRGGACIGVFPEGTISVGRQMRARSGFGHGFCVLSDEADVDYQLSSYYDPATESGVAWDDPDIGVEWPIDEPLLSERDKTAPKLADVRDALPF